MMNRGKPYRQRGQATMEIAAALIAIVFLVMGFFTLGGIGITSVKSLILTRYAAEMDAEGSTSGRHASQRQLSGWYYSVMKQKTASGGETQIVIPFLAGDEERLANSTAAADYLENETASLSLFPDRAQQPLDAKYRFLGYRQTPDASVPFAVYTGNSVDLAMLHFHAAELPDANRNEQNYLFRKMDDSESFKRRFSESGWFDARGIDITKWPSSTFAFPAFGPRRSNGVNIQLE